MRERAQIWEEGREMKAKGGGNDRGVEELEELVERYRELVAMQSGVIHALAAALGAVGTMEEEEEEGKKEVGEEGK